MVKPDCEPTEFNGHSVSRAKSNRFWHFTSQFSRIFLNARPGTLITPFLQADSYFVDPTSFHPKRWKVSLHPERRSETLLFLANIFNLVTGTHFTKHQLLKAELFAVFCLIDKVSYKFSTSVSEFRDARIQRPERYLSFEI